jgi:hypothetical protein
VQSAANLLSGGTDRSPGVVQALARLPAELAHAVLNSGHRVIYLNACTLRRPRLARLLAG